MKQIYFWSILIGILAGPIVNSVSTESSWVRSGMDILDRTVFHFSAETNVGIIVLTYLLILLVPLVSVFFLITATLWKFIENFRRQHSLVIIFKASLIFAICFLISSFIFMLLTQVG